MRTRAVRDGDDFVVNGSKTFITNAGHADLIVLVARTCERDKAAFYGRGHSRFHENKRAVTEKYMGPIVKTIVALYLALFVALWTWLL